MVEGDMLSNMAAAAEELKNKPKSIVDLLKRTVAKGATEEELVMFLYMARKFRLDPFAGEIYFMKTKRGETNYIVSRDGYLKIAMMNPEFEGLNSFVVKEGDEFEIRADKGEVYHRFGSKRGRIIGAWAIAHRKGYKPCVVFVDFNEYAKPRSESWKQYPSAMIQKVAEVAALRRQFNISGLYIREELDNVRVPPANVDSRVKQPAKAVVLDSVSSSSSLEESEGSKPISTVKVEPVEGETTPDWFVDPDSDSEDVKPEEENGVGAAIFQKVRDELKSEGKNVTKGTVVMRAMQKLKKGEMTQDDVNTLKAYLKTKGDL